MIVVEGTRGSGKTMLLRAARDWLAEVAPHAQVDFARFDSTIGAPEVLSALAFQLNRRYPVYEALDFPRLLVGIEVLRQNVDTTNRDRARTTVLAMLQQARDLETLQTAFKDLAAVVLQTLQSTTGTPVADATGWLPNWLPRTVVSQLIKGRRGRRMLLGDHQDWYGHQGRGLRHDSIDVLIDLNQWHANPDLEDNRAKVSRLLTEAFVADVLQGFHDAHRVSELSLNLLVTLENADTALGTRFAGDLAETLRSLNERLQSDPAPLTVIATSHGTLLSTADEVIEADPHGNWSPPATGLIAPWLRLRLTDFSAQEVDSALRARIQRQGNDAQLRMMLMQLTGGHPASVQLLIRALARSPAQWREPARLLDQPSPELMGAALGSSSLAQAMIRVLLGKAPEPGEHLIDLMICAAATRRQHARKFATDDEPLMVGGLARFNTDIGPVLWPAVPGTSSDLLRRLLLRDLALSENGLLPVVSGLPDASPTSTKWSVAFGRLQQGDEADKLYYTLALGDLATVAQQLDMQVGSGPSAPWLDLLAQVTAAPRRPSRPTITPSTPLEEMRALTENATVPGQTPNPLAELVAACWIAADPFVGNRRNSLHAHIAQQLESLVRRWPQDSEPLIEAAQSHRSQAGLWD
ncbi:hypothetical protein [Streptomyces sp. CBMA156]|uniref:hypothetical protein n=1 Tax=Streptomyces sp. CBMA156 TaxID=1930280 RepID=UPI001661B184|nr:hypothetical protein [Streptomyces sp. CBMA156]MBD0673100.1 hypothetical protein [Streptomyces sp. CBMA156]